eukprot:754462-Hanusia_phi.AAC.1
MAIELGEHSTICKSPAGSGGGAEYESLSTENEKRENSVSSGELKRYRETGNDCRFEVLQETHGEGRRAGLSEKEQERGKLSSWRTRRCWQEGASILAGRLLAIAKPPRRGAALLWCAAQSFRLRSTSFESEVCRLIDLTTCKFWAMTESVTRDLRTDSGPPAPGTVARSRVRRLET